MCQHLFVLYQKEVAAVKWLLFYIVENYSIRAPYGAPELIGTVHGSVDLKCSYALLNVS